MGEAADDGCVDVFLAGEVCEVEDVFLGDGEHHSFLGLGDPDFVVAEAGVFEGNFVEVHLGAGVGGHFTDGTGEAPGAAVGDVGE